MILKLLDMNNIHSTDSSSCCDTVLWVYKESWSKFSDSLDLPLVHSDTRFDVDRG